MDRIISSVRVLLHCAFIVVIIVKAFQTVAQGFVSELEHARFGNRATKNLRLMGVEWGIALTHEGGFGRDGINRNILFVNEI